MDRWRLVGIIAQILKENTPYWERRRLAGKWALGY
jgi:hypothetical protein